MDVQQRISTLADQSAALGADVLRVRRLAGATLDYSVAMPALSDLRDSLSSLRETTHAEKLHEEADAIIGALQNMERGAEPRGIEAEAIPRATFESLKSEYDRLFATCEIRPEFAGQVDWHVSKLKSGRAAYERVGQRAKIPWFFVGIVHGLEASFRFSGHLHNGDPLTARTVQAPPGRPPVWNPPNDWDASATDALEYEGFTGRSDWGFARMLYRWEAYNGFGSRAHHVNTPYLWSFSSHYDRGKFRADRDWDPNLVSKQCGAAVMLKALVNDGIAALPAQA